MAVCEYVNHLCVCLQSVGSGLSLEPPATTEADEEEDGMSDIIQEVTDAVNIISSFFIICLHSKDDLF